MQVGLIFSICSEN